jgi:hypothetical protein
MLKVKRFDTVSDFSKRLSSSKKTPRLTLFTVSSGFIMNFKRKINFNNLSKKIELNKHLTMPYIFIFIWVKQIYQLSKKVKFLCYVEINVGFNGDLNYILNLNCFCLIIQDAAALD